MIKRSLAATCLSASALAIAMPAAAQEVTRVPFRLPTGIATSSSVPGGFKIYYISGQLPTIDANNPGDMYTQAKSVIAKLVKELAAIGLKPQDAVKANVFLLGDPKTGKMDFDGFSKAWQEVWPGTQKELPARSTVMVSGLALPGALIEIEMIAASR